jgi:hypothetical protein
MNGQSPISENATDRSAAVIVSAQVTITDAATGVSESPDPNSTGPFEATILVLAFGRSLSLLRD